MGRRLDPHAASNGTTTKGIGSALRTGNGIKAQLDAMRAVIRGLIASSLLILSGHAIGLLLPKGSGQEPGQDLEYETPR